MKTSQTLRIAACAFFVLAGPASALDPLSYARYDQVKTSALHLDLKADFQRKSLGGFAELTLEWLDKSAKTLDLDTHSLAISRIEAQDARGQWAPVTYKLGPFDAEKGSALQVDLPNQPKKVRIHYKTAPTAKALQWLTPAQTMSGKHPFMFSQNQPINARSWVPSQDTPAVRFPYSAHIDAPAGLRVVMSAENDPKATGKGGWTFKMPQPVSAYMIAIGIGELEGKSLGPRTAVYAEPLRMKAAAYELADTEKMIDAAESLYGPYRWGRYDMLVLPPSFPIGGMENPRMTFLTPTMIAGDRSLVDLVAHELAHSWSGNLVTNATWKHWWLNEGVTTYVTTRILEKLYGTEVALMNLQLEQEEALASLADIPVAKQALLTRDPDTSNANYTDEGLAYPKGAWFLHTLEQRAGRARFDKFLRSWFDNHAFQSVTNDQFREYLQKNLLAANPQIMSEAELDEWMYGPGIPKSAKRAHSERLARLDAAIAGWIKGDIATSKLPVKGWTATEWMKFLNDIDTKVSAARLKELDQAFGLATTKNNEVAFRFYRAAIHAGYTDAIREPLRAFLMSVGRQKFVVPLYTALVQDPKERAFAVGVFAKARERYHPETQASVARVMPKK
ncbi:M1 family metallopeptidase [Pseudoduganella sp. GCM10020061]|uniref:M1 family metallopeptidase n=1 Tax=Pseudoduganella sp. GCM10020061 TaxID=3317345 RepID=UPI0036382796